METFFNAVLGLEKKEEKKIFLRDKRGFKLRSGLVGSPTAELSVGGHSVHA